MSKLLIYWLTPLTLTFIALSTFAQGEDIEFIDEGSCIYATLRGETEEIPLCNSIENRPLTSSTPDKITDNIAKKCKNNAQATSLYISDCSSNQVNTFSF